MVDAWEVSPFGIGGSMLAGLAGIGLFSNLLGGIFQSDVNNKSNKILDDLATSEKALIQKQEDQLAQQQAQPALIEKRTMQEQMNAELQTKNNPFSNPLSISSAHGLGGKIA